MGLVVPFVGYVSGLNQDGSDVVSDYVVKKRNFLRKTGVALSEFAKFTVKKKFIFVNSEYVSEDYADYVERDICKRVLLKELDYKKLTLVVTDITDLCRNSRSRTKEEVEVLKVIANSNASIFFVPGFSHPRRTTDYLPYGDLENMHNRGVEICSTILSGHYKSMSYSNLEDFFCKVVGYNMEGHSLVRRKSDSIK